jgi:hypothetical protein
MQHAGAATATATAHRHARTRHPHTRLRFPAPSPCAYVVVEARFRILQHIIPWVTSAPGSPYFVCDCMCRLFRLECARTSPCLWLWVVAIRVVLITPKTP